MRLDQLEQSDALATILASWDARTGDGGDMCERSSAVPGPLPVGEGWWTRTPSIVDAAACGCSGCGCDGDDVPDGPGMGDRAWRSDAPPAWDWSGDAWRPSGTFCPEDSRRFAAPLLYYAGDGPPGFVDLAVNQYVAADIGGEFGIAIPPTISTLAIKLPDVGCCPPFVSPRPCSVLLLPYVPLNVRYRRWDDLEAILTRSLCDPADETPTVLLVQAAVSFLRENLDIAEWALCLVAGYVPRTAFANINANLDTLVQGVSQMIQGTLPNPAWPNWSGLPAPEWSITVHGWKFDPEVNTVSYGEPMSSVAYTSPNGDGSIGINVYAYSTRVQNWLASYGSPDPAVQVCGLAGCAGTVLHELTHVWVKLLDYDGMGGSYGYHTWYPGDEDANPRRPTPDPWDTARMAKNAFLWAIAQRYAGCGNTVYPAERFLSSGVPVDDEPTDPPSDAYPCANYVDADEVPYPCPGGFSLPRPDVAIPFDLVSASESRPIGVPWGDEVAVIFDGVVRL